MQSKVQPNPRKKMVQTVHTDDCECTIGEKKGGVSVGEQ